ncbi:MAG: transglutaminase family protein, partial [Pseudomonadales bacterium]|nr:transglutaminase family protein [Pseudomonadales bacterium]
MKRLNVFHETTYTFDQPVELGQHRLLIRPREGHDIRIESSSLNIQPLAVVKWHRDEFDNSVAIASFEGSTRQLSIVSQVTVQHYDEWPLDFLVEDHAVTYPFAYNHDEQQALIPYLQFRPETETTLFDQWTEQFTCTGDTETYSLLSQISQAIGSELNYCVREEPGVQTAHTTLSNQSGSCRDFAWLFMHTARKLGLAARFVSGYLHDPAAEMADGATHAWAEVYLPGAGWKGFDPTSARVTGAEHIATAVSVNPESIPPVSGKFTGPLDVNST